MTISLYEKAVALWGTDAQIRMAIEECSELITKLVKLGRNTNGSSNEEIAEEIADVEIMMTQLRVIFGNALIDMKKSEKLERLLRRIDSEKGS